MSIHDSAATGEMLAPMVGRIVADINEAFERLSLRWTAALQAEALSEREDTARAWIEIALSDYTALLQMVWRCQKGPLGKSVVYATERLLDSHEGKVAGLVRGLTNTVPCRCRPNS